MLLFNATLVDVQDGDYKSLVFEAKKYDNRLKKNVVYAESVGISKECEQFIGNYKRHIGEMVLVGVSALVTKKGGIFLLSTTDVIDIETLGVIAQ